MTNIVSENGVSISPELPQDGPIFLYSGYRASSTWLWNKFRQDRRCWAYYEPFNEGLAHLTPSNLLALRPDMWRSHHPNDPAYMIEYAPLLGDNPGVPLFPIEAEPYQKFVGIQGIDGALDQDVEAYAASLIDFARKRGRIPLLACTRMLGRSAGFKQAFGGIHMLLIRNLFQQWNSYAGQANFGNFYFLNNLYDSLSLAPRNDYVNFIASYFSEERKSSFENWISRDNFDLVFCYFIGFYIYFLLNTRRVCDLVIDANQLARNGEAYQSEVTEHIFRFSGIRLNLNDARESIDYPLHCIQSRKDCELIVNAFVDKIVQLSGANSEECAFIEGLVSDLWEEQARFTVCTGGVPELLAIRSEQSAEIHETAARLEAAHAAAEAALLDAQNEAHAANANAQTAAAELQSLLDTRTLHLTEALAQAEAEAAQQAAAVQRLDEAISTSSLKTQHLEAELDRQYRKASEMSRELGQFEGKLAAQSEAHQITLSRAEEAAQYIISDLNDRLVKADAALHAARAEAARQLEHYHKSQLLESDRLAKKEFELALSESKIGNLEAEMAKLAERISDLQEAQRSQAEAHTKAVETIRFQSELADNLRNECDQSKALVNYRETQLREAASLVEGIADSARKWLERPTRWFTRPSHRRNAGGMSEKLDAIDRWLQNQKQNERYFHTAQLETLDDQEQSAYASVNQPAGVDVENEGPITSVPRLLAPHDVDFIQAAYQSVLGRAPDSEGMAYYLQRLRAGTHKLTILKQLRRSPEGREFIPGVAGLDRAIKRHQIGTMPIFGALVRLFTGAEGNSATHRQLRIMANEMGRLRGEQAALAGMVQELAAQPILVASDATSSHQPTPPQPAVLPPPPAVSPPPAAQAPLPPSLDPGPMPETLDSQERRLLSSLRLFALTRGAPA